MGGYALVLGGEGFWAPALADFVPAGTPFVAALTPGTGPEHALWIEYAHEHNGVVENVDLGSRRRLAPLFKNRPDIVQALAADPRLAALALAAAGRHGKPSIYTAGGFVPLHPSDTPLLWDAANEFARDFALMERGDDELAALSRPFAANDWTGLTSLAHTINMRALTGSLATVVIPSRNRAKQLDLTLAALAVQNIGCYRFNVVVVDDNSTDDTERVLARWSGHLQLTALHRRRRPREGFDAAGARNLWVRHMMTHHPNENPLLILLDADMLPTRRFVERHVRLHAAAAKAGAEVVVIGRRGELPKSATERLTAEDLLADMTRSDALAMRDEFSGLGPEWLRNELGQSAQLRTSWRPYMCAAGGNLSFHLDLLRRAGPFDDSFRAWGHEDNELAYRLYQCGAYFVPDAEAIALHQWHARTAGSRESDLNVSFRQFVARVPPMRPPGYHPRFVDASLDDPTDVAAAFTLVPLVTPGDGPHRLHDFSALDGYMFREPQRGDTGLLDGALRSEVVVFVTTADGLDGVALHQARLRLRYDQTLNAVARLGHDQSFKWWATRPRNLWHYYLATQRVPHDAASLAEFVLWLNERGAWAAMVGRRDAVASLAQRLMPVRNSVKVGATLAGRPLPPPRRVFPVVRFFG